jgi:pSer/pThr/pTyr-binding forkhead associated (FHA) protein
MKHVILRDEPAGKTHNLSDLVRQYKKISVGRSGFGNVIELEVSVKTKEGKESKVSTPDLSRKHATVIYLSEPSGERFYLLDHSTNGTRVNSKYLRKGEQTLLNHGDKIWFGSYGPLGYEEVEKIVERD